MTNHSVNFGNSEQLAQEYAELAHTVREAEGPGERTDVPAGAVTEKTCAKRFQAMLDSGDSETIMQALNELADLRKKAKSVTDRAQVVPESGKPLHEQPAVKARKHDAEDEHEKHGKAAHPKSDGHKTSDTHKQQK